MGNFYRVLQDTKEVLLPKWLKGRKCDCEEKQRYVLRRSVRRYSHQLMGG